MSKIDISPAVDNRLHKSAKPFNGRTGERWIDDPYNAGRRVVATASLRDDPLGRMHSRRQIKDYQYAAGHYMQGMFELAEIGSVQAMDPSKEPVDGRGQFIEPITDQQRRAIRRLTEARQKLGERSYRLVYAVLGQRQFIEQVATAAGVRGKVAVGALAARFRECLDELADLYGFRGEGPAAKRKRDQFSHAAQHADNPILHLAIERAKRAA